MHSCIYAYLLIHTCHMKSKRYTAKETQHIEVKIYSLGIPIIGITYIVYSVIINVTSNKHIKFKKQIHFIV